MRCKACNEILSDEELKIKDNNGQFEDMCLFCLGLVKERYQFIYEFKESDINE